MDLSKKQYNTNIIRQVEEQELQWVSNTGKTSFVWKFFQAKTDGCTYCRKIDKEVIKNDEECGYSCIYKTQTSSMLYHIHIFHKKFKKKLEVSINMWSVVKTVIFITFTIY